MYERLCMRSTFMDYARRLHFDLANIEVDGLEHEWSFTTLGLSGIGGAAC
jgi:hypothetical protein